MLELKNGVWRGASALELKDDDGDIRIPSEMKRVLEDLQDFFNDSRKKQDGRISAIERRIDEALLEARRPRLSIDEPKALKLPQGWEDYLRKGFTHGIEEKALSSGSNPDGGYLVPQVLAERIVDVARDRSSIRAIANVVQITGGAYEIPVDPHDLGAEWVSEHGARPETSTPQLAKITLPVHEIYANPKATQTILDDSAVNIESWLTDRVRDIFDRKENAAFVNGNGVGKPWGFLQYPKIADSSWAWGSIGYLATGATDFAADPDAADDFIDAVYSLKTEYRANARWIMNSKTAARVRKFRDSDDNYLWIQSIVAGQPSTLLGYPVVIAEDMPDVADGAYPVAFGDFRRGYTIVDRVGVRVLRDPFTAKPYVMFYTTKRVGGGVVDFDAIKLIKTASS